MILSFGHSDFHLDFSCLPVNSFPANGDFCHLLITIVNNLAPDLTCKMCV